MRKEVKVGFYFMLYVGMPFLALHFLILKYPTLENSSAPFISMIYFLSVFVFSTIGLYIKYTSIPTAISIAATIIYMDLVFSHIQLNIMGASITLQMGSFMMLLYLLLILKMGISIYADIKQKHLSASTD